MTGQGAGADPDRPEEVRGDGEGATLSVGYADTPRDYLVIYLKGAAMGAADAVPGVSGGTIALVTGIYERLIDAITDVDVDLVTSFLRSYSAEGREEFLARFRALDLGFLLALGFGVVTAVVTVSRVLEVALEEHTALTFAFFFGLIAASAFVLYDAVEVNTPRRIGAAVAGFVVAFVLTGELTAVLPNTLPVVLVAGAIAVSAMILPGISGSFLLLVLGQYRFVVNSLSGFTDALLARDLSAAVADGRVLVVFALGAVVGLLSVARVIEYALEHHRAPTLAFLVSLMVGALRLPVEEILDATWALTLPVVGSLVLAALVGAVAVVGLDHYTQAIL